MISNGFPAKKFCATFPATFSACGRYIIQVSCIGILKEVSYGAHVVIALAATTRSVYGADIVVNSTAQEVPAVANGNCTLGEAITAANTDEIVDACTAGSGADTIRLGTGTVYTLTKADNGVNGLPVITSDVKLTGRAPIIERSTAGGTPSFRLLKVQGGPLAIEDVILKGGNPGDNSGGAINNGGTLAIEKCTISNNTSGGQGGGAIDTNSGILTISNSTISHNTTSENGGGLRGNSSTLTITNSIISGNSAKRGGAIYSAASTMTLNGSTISQNTSTLYGGGILAEVSGTLTMKNSTIRDNSATAPYDGGGLYGGGTTVTVGNSTVAKNTGDRGGGIYQSGGTVTIRNSTIGGNTASSITDGGGGIYANGAAVTFQNTILADNTSAVAPDCDSFGGAQLSSLGNNVFGDLTNCELQSGATDKNGSPALDTFADDGTAGHGYYPLKSASPAIDGGNTDACAGDYVTDQLGKSRYGPCDIGSIEFGSCGDGFLQASVEECDAGAGNADSGACTSQCKNAKCGDGLVQTGIEACDDGNTTSGDGCSNICAAESSPPPQEPSSTSGGNTNGGGGTEGSGSSGSGDGTESTAGTGSSTTDDQGDQGDEPTAGNVSGGGCSLILPRQ
ncbi:MAG: DUF4215 domain-containing protein [Deltaproteobacteria bacterium]|nr:DUF4215 domain-containing protein [Deltaproteobacteria bacterium]